MLADTESVEAKQVNLDFNICIICQVSKSDILPTDVKKDSLEKMKEYAYQRYKCGDDQYKHLVNNLLKIDTIDILLKTPVYHKSCYSSLVNESKLERSRKRFQKALQTGEMPEKKKGKRLSLQGATDDNLQGKSSRSNVLPFDKEKCFICQSDSKNYDLHSVSTVEVGEKIISFKESLRNDLKVRLSVIIEPLDAVAYELKYHNACKRNIERELDHNEEKNPSDENIAKIIADIELLNFVKTVINEPEPTVTTINDLKEFYRKCYKNNGGQREQLDYRKYVKDLISENLPSVEFRNPKQKNKPQFVCSKRTVDMCVNTVIDMSTVEKYETLHKAAMIIRAEILNQKKWEFKGIFDDFSVPGSLKMFVKWLTAGKTEILSEIRQERVEMDSENISQYIINCTKTDAQVNYKPKNNNDSYFKKHYQTPLSVGISLMIYKKFRSKDLINILHDFNITESYDQTQRIVTSISENIVKEADLNDNCHIPNFIIPNQTIIFAADNVDFNINSQDGKGSFHGTDLIIAQKASDAENTEIRSFDTTKNRCLKTQLKYKTFDCVKPCPPKIQIPNFSFGKFNNAKSYNLQDLTWGISMCIAVEEDSSENFIGPLPPPWSAFNSLISNSQRKTNVGVVAPIIPKSPTDWSTLLTVLKLAQNINTQVVGANRKTIISLDGQLYHNAVQLDQYKSQFCIRLGELHTIMASLKCIGHYVEMSGIDHAWEEAGIYSSVIVRQIIEGRHVKRAIEAHQMTFLALLSFFTSKYSLDKNIDLKLASEVISSFKEVSIDTIKHQSDISNQILSSNPLLEHLLEITEIEMNLKQFFINYMKQIMNLLLFIRASRDSIWTLHLESGEKMLKYFHAHDHYNYARWMSIYISDMQDLETRDPETWDALQAGEFCVNKNGLPFCGIGPDHAIEHQHKKMKIQGGVIGITHSQSNLDSFLISEPILAEILDEYLSSYTIKTSKNLVHHELRGKKNVRMANNAKTFIKVIKEHNEENIFEDDIPVCNILTKYVPSNDSQKEICYRDITGEALSKEFMEKRIVDGQISVWKPIRKNKFAFFKTRKTTITSKEGEKLISIRQERNLLARLVIISKARNLDLKELIGNYEYNIVPLSNFSPDGTMLLQTDKSKVLNQLENMANNISSEDSGLSHTTQNMKVVIIDGMAIVHQLPKAENVKYVKDLANLFIENVMKKSEYCVETRVIFDNYKAISLKTQMRQKRTKLINSVFYQVADNTLISKISLKQFLADVRTKDALTEYLSEALLKKFQELHRRLVVSYRNVSKSTFVDYDIEMSSHDHEEADTLVILHSMHVSKCYDNPDIHVYAPDTDIFLMLINKCNVLSSYTYFHIGSGTKERIINIFNICTQLAPEISNALLGYHAFTGCDVTGRFSGKTKNSSFKLFLTLDKPILSSIAKLEQENLSKTDILNLEHFVCMLYGAKTKTTLKDLRWKLFTQNNAEGAQLPPTYHTFLPHVNRANFVAMCWSRSTSGFIGQSIFPRKMSYRSSSNRNFRVGQVWLFKKAL